MNVLSMFSGGTKYTLSNFDFSWSETNQDTKKRVRGKKGAIWIDFIIRNPNPAVQWDTGKAPEFTLLLLCILRGKVSLGC